MGERTEEIEREIEGERERLRSNLEELRARVRSSVDWRTQFRNYPLLGLGVALGGGLLLASLIGRRGGDTRPDGRAYLQARTSRGRGQLLNAWETLQGALIGMAVSKVTEALVEWVPGIKEHLVRRTPAERAARSGNGNGLQGEGNYQAARRYRAGAERFVRSADVAAAARRAAPRNESEAEELEAAEDEGRARGKPS
jgi:hypothetical protein